MASFLHRKTPISRRLPTIPTRDNTPSGVHQPSNICGEYHSNVACRFWLSLAALPCRSRPLSACIMIARNKDKECKADVKQGGEPTKLLSSRLDLWLGRAVEITDERWQDGPSLKYGLQLPQCSTDDNRSQCYYSNRGWRCNYKHLQQSRERRSSDSGKYWSVWFLYGRTVRRIIEGDIKLRHQLSSKVLTVNVDSQRGASTSEPGLRAVKVKQRAKDFIFRRCLRSKILSIVIKPREGLSTSRALPGSSQVVKVKKTNHTAEICGYSGVFTVTTLEPVDEKDRDKFEEVSISVQTERNNYLIALDRGKLPQGSDVPAVSMRDIYLLDVYMRPKPCE
ncbi:hypothetical protein PM082_023314 [Marasmius tenuissimus]|nr:hypothetical protein PM082_023314 [Marasmius tenuissimus]